MRPTRVIALLLALALVPIAAACGDAARPEPSPAAVETAESVSRPVVITAPSDPTPDAGSEDHGAELHGHVFGDGPVGVVLAHMRPADQRAWFPFAAMLARTHRYTVLTFDFRGFGESPGDKDFDAVGEDLRAAYDYLSGQPHIDKMFLVGASMCATASLVLGTQVPVAGVISVSAPGEFPPLDAIAAVPHLTVPKLFIVSSGDVPQAKDEETMYAEATNPKDQAIYDGNAHGTDLLQSPHAQEVEQQIMAFLAQY